MSFKLSIVIPVYNKYNFTKACLEDLARLQPDYQVVVVDNGSSDETQTELEKIDRPNFKYLRQSQNLGFSGGCNAGYAASDAPNVMFLNNDIRVQGQFEDWPQLMLDHLKRFPKAIVGPTLGILDDRFNFLFESNDFKDAEKYRNHYMSGWNITASKETWDALTLPNHDGPFTTEFGIAYFEDTDLGMRAKPLGHPFIIQPCNVFHFGKVTSKSVGLSKLYGEARILFLKKWANK